MKRALLDQGPASGVDYFSQLGTEQGRGNVDPGVVSLADETPPAGTGLGQGQYRGESSYDSTGTTVGGEGTTAAQSIGGLTAGDIGRGASLLGTVTGTPGLSMMGGVMGAADAAANGRYGPAVSTAANFAGASPGVAGLLGMGVDAANGSLTAKQVANTAVGYAVPGYGLLNALSGGRVGSALFGTDAGLAPGGAFTAPAQAGLIGSWGVQSVGPTVDGTGAPSAGTQVGAVGGDAGYSFSSASMPTGLAGPLGNIASLPTGFNMTTAPSNVLGAADADGQQSGFNSWGGGWGSGAEARGGGGWGSGAEARGGFGGHSEGLADGGMVSEAGLPGPSGGPMLAMGYAKGGSVQMGAQPKQGSVVEQVNQLLRDPATKQRITGHAQQLMASGELTPQEVQVMSQVAEAAMYNPQMYPQLRQFVAEQGMTPLPPSYDQSVIVKIMAVARALQEAQPGTPPGQVPGQEQAQISQPVPGMGNGGMIHGPGTGRSDSIGTVNETTGAPVKVANDEYVIPAHVVRAKGREFFDNLLRRYSELPKEQA